MSLIKLGFKRKEEITGNANALTGLGIGAAGIGLAAHSATLPLRERIKLTPGSRRIAIVYPGAASGGGHAVPAKALAEAYQAKGYQVDYYNVHDYQNKPTKKYISNLYAEAVAADPVKQMPTNTEFDFNKRRAPMWKEIENAKAGKFPHTHILQHPVGQELWNVASGHSRVVKELKRKPYERIFGMHGLTIDTLKHTGVPADVITTDFIHDPFVWKTNAAGQYFVPSEHAKKRFTDIGVPAHKVITTGSLLVRKELKTPEKLQVPDEIMEIRKKNPNAHITTVMGGGTGIQVDQIGEQVAKYYSKKNPNAHVIIIAGQNKKAEDYLHNLKAQGHIPNTTVLGYRTNAVNFMRHSDLVITRPGGSTTAEALHLGTPVVTFNHADVAKDFNHIGSHEHGNVKTLHEHGMSRHFRTEYTVQDTKKITNIHALDEVLEDVHNNYGTLKTNAVKTSEKFTKLSPESVIMSTPPASARKLKLRTLGKIGIGAGLLVAGLGAYQYHQARKEKGPLLKISEDHTLRNIGLTAAGIGIGIGALASTVFPKLRGGSNRVVGAFKATKNIFYDYPKYLISKGRQGKFIGDSIGFPSAKKLGNEKVDALVRLTPTEIAQRSATTLKSKDKIETFRSHSELLEKSKQFDARSTIQMLKEKEDKARKAGLSKLVGFSHFAPSQAERFGFVESDIVAPKLQPILSKHGPLSYYKSERVNSLKKLKEKGIHSLDEMDAYWITAPKKGVRLFEKDLTISHEEAVQRAHNSYAKMPLVQKKELNNVEISFKKRYDNMLKIIAHEKDKHG